MIRLDYNPTFSQAAWQNAVPLVHSLQLSGSLAEPQLHLQLTLTCEPLFAAERSWNIPQLRPGQVLTIEDCEAVPSPAFFQDLNEACRGLLQLVLRDSAGRVLDQQSHPVRLLSRHEWGGCSDRLELLAAFVLPNDPAVPPLLRETVQILQQQGLPALLDGYVRGSRDVVTQTVAALWSAVCARGIHYALPPAGFEDNGQKVRTVSEVLQQQLGTCLDLTLVFCSALEAAGLRPVIVIQSGHCFPGVWLHSTAANQLADDDLAEVRKAIAAGELLVFESTLAAAGQAVPFASAAARARQETAASAADKFCVLLDLHRARLNRIRPLPNLSAAAAAEASAGAVATSSAASAIVAAVAAEAPADTAGDSEGWLASDPAEARAISRMERWQRRLLDLSLRNRLLNFRLTRGAVSFLCPDPGLLEDLLSAGEILRIVSLPAQLPLASRDAARYEQQTGEHLERAVALDLLLQNELAASAEPAPLQLRLTELYRQARSDLAEGGSNTLVLALGFLRWRRTSQDSRQFLAPLLLLPVQLHRQHASAPFELVAHADDPQFNSTLVQLLKRDFQCDLSRVETQLPTDDSGLDVAGILQLVRQLVRPVRGLEVLEDVALATFSFARHLLWKDLVDRGDVLEENRLIRYLVRQPDQPYSSGGSGPLPTPEDVDRLSPGDLKAPLPADSSQLRAVATAAAGHDFVLIGPPGTGKSQTIANIIAQCLSQRRSVLFVAEKTAALEVVQRRLELAGLGRCCLELHSARADRKAVLQQLQAAWQSGSPGTPAAWQRQTEQVARLRQQLNETVAALHARHEGWSVFSGAGECIQRAGETIPEWSQAAASQPDYQELRRGVTELAEAGRSVQFDQAPMWIRRTQWSVQWEQQLLQQAARLAELLPGWQQTLAELGDQLQLPLQQLQPGWLPVLQQLLQVLPRVTSAAVLAGLGKQFAQLQQAAGELQGALEKIAAARQKLSADYPLSSLPEVPVASLQQGWREAGTAFWLLAWWRRRGVRRRLQVWASAGQVQPARDLPLLKTIQAELQRAQQARQRLFPQATNAVGSAGSEQPDEDALQQLTGQLQQRQQELQLAAQLRQAIWALQQQTGHGQQVAVRLRQLLADAATRSQLQQLATRCAAATDEFQRELTALEQLAGGSWLAPDNATQFAGLSQQLARLPAVRRQLRPLTAWNAAAGAAAQVGLQPFVQAICDRQLSPDELESALQLAWARCFVPQAVDGSTALREFQGTRQVARQAQFAAADDQLRNLAVPEVLRLSAHKLPAAEAVSRNSELGLLRHQMQLKRPSCTIRSLLTTLPENFRRLTPCVMMSPLSVAQYLPADMQPFDVVIFDEASQIPTWDAIGAIGRGRQTIIVGDPKQLPPTSFFQKSDAGESEDELPVWERDLESILDEAVAAGLPRLQLNWHYRSRHESLIAFSNQHYYDGTLVTLPSTAARDTAVNLVYLPHAVYDRGETRTNRVEAEAIVRQLLLRLQQQPAEAADRLSFGVITFNQQQQKLIEDLLDEARRQDPGLEQFFSDDQPEPVFVKNLENVQGDERDVILFSVAFGLNERGQLPLNLGALNRQGGERRLNVAITRARRELVVCSSILGEQIAVERTQARGVLDLRKFLIFARDGAAATAGTVNPAAAAATPATGPLFGSPHGLRTAVAASLRDAGYQVQFNVGQSAAQVELAVLDPSQPDRFIAAIEFDGHLYAGAATARDRETTRRRLLESLGWRVIFVWTLDWWYDPDRARADLLQQLPTAN